MATGDPPAMPGISWLRPAQIPLAFDLVSMEKIIQSSKALWSWDGLSLERNKAARNGKRRARM
jgi:hypothetical protein